MANYDYDEDSEDDVSQRNDSSLGIAIMVAAFVLIVGAVFLLISAIDQTTDNPQIVQNNVAPQVPVIEAPAIPEVTNPSVTQPTTPPAEPPAANP